MRTYESTDMAVFNHRKQGVEFRIVTKEEKALVDRVKVKSQGVAVKGRLEISDCQQGWNRRFTVE